MKGTYKSRVVVKRSIQGDDSDRFDILIEALDETGFWESLDSKWRGSGKQKGDFLIAIKPNIMMYYSQEDPHVITEPALVEHLVESLYEKGFRNIALIESQNVIGNWFSNRDVLTVAKAAGYHEGGKTRIVDISKEKVQYRYSGDLGDHWVSPTWRDADFRISFAKNKTHFSCYYTLTLKEEHCTRLADASLCNVVFSGTINR